MELRDTIGPRIPRWSSATPLARGSRRGRGRPVRRRRGPDRRNQPGSRARRDQRAAGSGTMLRSRDDRRPGGDSRTPHRSPGRVCRPGRRTRIGALDRAGGSSGSSERRSENGVGSPVWGAGAPMGLRADGERRLGVGRGSAPNRDRPGCDPVAVTNVPAVGAVEAGRHTGRTARDCPGVRLQPQLRVSATTSTTSERSARTTRGPAGTSTTGAVTGIGSTSQMSSSREWRSARSRAASSEPASR